MVEMERVEKGVPIRSVSRALAMLRQINRDKTMNMKELAEAIAVPYPTAVRLVQTLIYEGFIERQATRHHYQVTDLAKSLSCGIDYPEDIVRIGRPYITDLTEKTGWPLAIARRVGAFMVIQDSTHSLTTLTLSEYNPGFALPIHASASGLLYLAHCKPKTRSQILKSLDNRFINNRSAELNLLSTADDGIFEKVLHDGYAMYQYNPFTKDKGKTSSLAVPIIQNGEFIGALALIFFVAAMKGEQAVAKYLPSLKEAARAISNDLGLLDQ